MDIWCRCELRNGDDSQFQWVRHRAALVGNFFTIDQRKWEVFAVHFPGLPAALIEARAPTLKRR